jgi:hypothetical protein
MILDRTARKGIMMATIKILKSGIVVSVVAIAGLAVPAITMQSAAAFAALPSSSDVSALATAKPAGVTKAVIAAVSADKANAPKYIAAAVLAAPGSVLLIVSAASGVKGAPVGAMLASALKSLTPAQRAATAAVLIAAAAKASGQSIQSLAAGMAKLFPALGSASALAASAKSVDLAAALASVGATGSTSAFNGGDSDAGIAPAPEPAALNDGSPTALTAN